jgi:hypothetical protein
MFFCPIRLTCGNVSRRLSDVSLIDTGAGTCHMTYPLWCMLGLDKVCFEERKDLCELLKIQSADDMTFEKLPLVHAPSPSCLADGSEKSTYLFRLDKLVIEDKSDNAIVLKNITVRLIDSETAKFIVGMNVLRYLDISYRPTQRESICFLSQSKDGADLMEHHRKTGISNTMNSTFMYIEENN